MARSNRVAVTSSVISQIGYDAKTQALTVEFHSNEVYAYVGVPANVHSGLMSAKSHGEYFNANIRNKYATANVAAAR
jgi:hypothetical protein